MKTKALLLGLLLAVAGLRGQVQQPFLMVLGTVQDAGAPQIGCTKSCCNDLYKNPDHTLKVVSLGLVDPSSGQSFLLEATPDIASQAAYLAEASGTPGSLPSGIFLTHAHIGHYTGLMYLGREATNAKGIPVYAQDRFREFLNTNGPWNQLVALNNIDLKPLPPDNARPLTPNLSITALLVPHREEFSETVGYLIEGPSKTILFIPDIDKWNKWERSIVALVKQVDYAFIDATFYSGDELNTRDISQIPHPFVIESMALFDNLPMEERAKIQFIHFNHTNPLLDPTSEAFRNVIAKGYGIAQFGQKFGL